VIAQTPASVATLDLPSRPETVDPQV